MGHRNKQMCIGLMAHVDGGKTTLSEALLYKTGAIRSRGRVDHKNTFLDSDSRERARGITIFSKEARFTCKGAEIVILDTPGHVDFSAEMERTLYVMDYAVLLISGREGIQGHTRTLWNLLAEHKIPAFVFINKMDLKGGNRDEIMEELRETFGECFVDFSAEPDYEEIAMADEELLCEYLKNERISEAAMAEAIYERKLFPCYFGSALKMEGIDELIAGLTALTIESGAREDFGARVYKITRDSQGLRLTHMKITGGCLKVRDLVDGEKVNQIRLYSGEKYKTVDAAEAGMLCAVTGLDTTGAGQGMGFERGLRTTALSPVMSYSCILPSGQDKHEAYSMLKHLEDEDPKLHISWDSSHGTIEIRLMGQVQLEILRDIISERFAIDVKFDKGRISYRETISAPVIGAGHFEPLRHYAEVHFLLEPGERGSGLVFDSICSEDVLDRNWQRLIMTHLEEREHVGVLTGSPITDMKITLVAAKAHIKHTEGGDFRQATYRAIRQGLMKAQSLLLEPWYEFRLLVPDYAVGRAMSDVNRMGGSFSTPETSGGTSVITGRAPVSEMKDYEIQVNSYTGGRGNLFCTLWGYEVCHNGEEVISAIGYDADRDVENTGDSIFCSHGAGHNVKWNEVDNHLHIELRDKKQDAIENGKAESKRNSRIEERELQRIFEMTYGKPKERRLIPPKVVEAEPQDIPTKTKPVKVLPEYLLVDGYNIIFAWDDLKELARTNLDASREALIEILENYQGYRRCNLILVFDAYKVKGGERHYEKRGGIDVVFTKEAETADTYIERTTYEIGKKYNVRVATSDYLEQMIIIGNGGTRISANEFKAEVETVKREIAQLMKSSGH